MSFEIYDEKHFEVYDPQEARQVALFFREEDARAYVVWVNGPATKQGNWLDRILGKIFGASVDYAVGAAERTGAL